MRVLAISGSERDAAAAVSVNGEIVAAAAEESFARVRRIGYRYTGGYPLSAIGACLNRAGLCLADIDRVVAADGDGCRHSGAGLADAATEVIPRSTRDEQTALETQLCARVRDSVDPLRADARLAATAYAGDDVLVFVLAPELGASATFCSRGADLKPLQVITGADQLLCTIRRVERSLGYQRPVPYETLEHVGVEGLPEHAAAFARAMEWSPARGIVIHQDCLIKALGPLGSAAESGGNTSVSPRVQQDRQTLTASFCARVNELLVQMAGSLSSSAGIARVAFGGGLFSGSALAGALTEHFGDGAVLSPLPEPAGRAIGAALEGDDASPKPLESLALGPEFSESEIKLALENCRLDYLYEPDWSRLIGRVSRMLSRGSVVAWFQGPMGFGPRTVGTRSILCDPSNRYARENINRFLRHVAIDEPLPVSMTASAIQECLASPAASPFVTVDTTVTAQWRDRLRAALDSRHAIPVQMASVRQAPALVELLQLHRDRSSVPGLISLTLNGKGETIACTPRDAVRTMFSSAIDALVIGRFLLMKDYWLLRSGADLQ